MRNNLFGFDYEEYDPYAGMSHHSKLKKMVSKANIKLLLHKDKGFMKQKSLSKKTKVMIAQPDSSVSGSMPQPMSTAHNNNGKTSSIAVNPEHIDPILENVKVTEHQDFITDSMSMAYTMLANKKSYESETLVKQSQKTTIEEVDVKTGEKKNVIHEEKMSKQYASYAGFARVMIAASTTSGGLKDMNKYAPSAATDQDSKLGQFMQTLTKGTPSTDKEVNHLIKKMENSHKDQKSANICVAQFMETIVKADVDSGKAKDVDHQLADSPHDLIPQYGIVNSNSKMDQDKKSDHSAGVGQGELDNDPEEDEKGINPSDKRWEQTQDSMEFDAQQENAKYKFFRDQGSRGEINVGAMEKLADELYDSLKGRMGRLANVNPSKRLSKRNLASGLTDKIYMSRTEEKGKHLKLNVIVDTSGSMSGHYIRDAKETIYVMNILAERGIFDGNVILSGTRAHALIPMPMPRDQVERIGAFGGGEGIREAFRKFKPEMKAVDFNICLTDGMLTDGHIDKEEMTRQGISITGAYVTGTTDTILEFTGSLGRWFHKSVVRPTTRELIMHLVNQGIMHSKSR